MLMFNWLIRHRGQYRISIFRITKWFPRKRVHVGTCELFLHVYSKITQTLQPVIWTQYHQE